MYGNGDGWVLNYSEYFAISVPGHIFLSVRGGGARVEPLCPVLSSVRHRIVSALQRTEQGTIKKISWARLRPGGTSRDSHYY